MRNVNEKKINSLEDEFEFLNDEMAKQDCTNQLVLSHNDLSQETIFKCLDSDEIYFLNYDLSGYNFRAYDLCKNLD